MPSSACHHTDLPSFPTRRSSDLAFDIQLGRVPPTFGAFPRRAYSTDNPFIGYPLAYQYLTSLRADALPANADELLQMRARGWLSRDRKSTRLNSSHVAISYAVFCLSPHRSTLFPYTTLFRSGI